MLGTLVLATRFPPLPPGLGQAPEDRSAGGECRSSLGSRDRVEVTDQLHRASPPLGCPPGARRFERAGASSSLPFPPLLGARCWPARYRTNRTNSTRAWGARRASCGRLGASTGGTTGTGRSVHCQGRESRRPFCGRRTTQGIPWRQKTRQTRSACPQAELSSARIVARAP